MFTTTAEQRESHGRILDQSGGHAETWMLGKENKKMRGM